MENRNKRRILGTIILPFTSEELLEQFQKAMKALEGVIVPPPYAKEDFTRLFEQFPLLASPISALRPTDTRQFWDNFGVWLLEKGIDSEAKVLGISPSIGPGANSHDVDVLSFASHHPWPFVIWRDAHCCRCFLLSAFNPNRNFDKKCSKHRCQTWAKQLLKSHTQLVPKWSQFTDIGDKYGSIIAFQASSEEDLFSRDEDKPIEFTAQPVIAWKESGNFQDNEHKPKEQKQLEHKPKEQRQPVNEARRRSVSLPLQFLASIRTKTTGVTMKSRKQDYRVKMKKGGRKYRLVNNNEKERRHLQETSSDDEML